MPTTNSNLHASMTNKEDEFYTEMSMIENELRYYKAHFQGKTVLCNCDDPYESNFFKYFVLNFNPLQLKRLICTCYEGSQFAGTQLSLFDDDDQDIPLGTAYYVDLKEVVDLDGDGAVTLNDVELLLRSKKHLPKKMLGNGDFRSQECINLLKQSDIVVTNPPFSLFREYIQQLFSFQKQFLIVGRVSAAFYKEVFPYFMREELWLGKNSGHFWFRVPDYYEEKKTDFKIDEFGHKWRRMGNICWFTNIDFPERHEELVLWNTMAEGNFIHYDNYDAIEVPTVSAIPKDYDGIMGVPITMIAKFNPDQFELLGVTSGRDEFDRRAWPTKRYIDAVQHNTNGTLSNGSKVNTGAAVVNNNPAGVYYTASNTNDKLEIKYLRVLIRNKKVQ